VVGFREVAMEGDPRKTVQWDWASDKHYRGAGLGRCGKKDRTEDLPSSGSVV
jgi:hypothetical protein